MTTDRTQLIACALLSPDIANDVRHAEATRKHRIRQLFCFEIRVARFFIKVQAKPKIETSDDTNTVLTRGGPSFTKLDGAKFYSNTLHMTLSDEVYRMSLQYGDGREGRGQDTHAFE